MDNGHLRMAESVQKYGLAWPLLAETLLQMLLL